MRANLISLITLAVVSIPASSQITATITRDPIARTTLSRLVLLSPVSPATGRRGQQSLTVQLTGMNTHFAKEMTTVNMGPGISIAGPLNVVSPTSATAVINIDAGASAGSRAVTVTTGTEVVSLADGFSVTENPDYFPKTCSTAANASLGMIYKGTSKQVNGFIDVASTEDWFLVSVPSGTNLKLTLTGAVPGSEFEVSASASCGAAALASTSPGISPKQIMLPGASSPYLIRVRASQWNAESSRFTLNLVAE